MKTTASSLWLVCLVLLATSFASATKPVANDDSYTTGRNQTLNIPAPGVLANDTDAESDPLTAVLQGNVSNGELTLNPNGSFSFVPELNFVGDVTFGYRADDGGPASNVATVTVHVVNHVPVAVNDAYSIAKNQPLTVAAPGVLGNDTEADGEAMTAVKVGDPASGTLTLSANGSFTYTPSAGFMGQDSFTYKASDGTLQSAVATVTVEVTNTAPPKPTSVVIVPGLAGKENLTGQATGEPDADGDSITYEYQWAKIDCASGQCLTKWADCCGQVLTADKVSFGETWMVRARSFDGTAYSAWKQHKKVTIVTLIAASYPLADAVGVPLDKAIYVRFRWPVDESSVRGRLKVWRNGSNLVSGHLKWSVANNVAMFVPSEPLRANSRYRVHIGSGVLCLDGRTLGWGEDLYFNTGAGTAPAAMTMSAAATGAGAQISLNLASAATVQAVICNMAGRVVATLPERNVEAGVSSLVWNGRSDSGSKIPSGNYLVRAMALGGDGTQASALAPLSLRR